LNKSYKPGDRVVLNIMFTANWLVQRINQALRPFGITEPQFNVLRILRGQHGRALNLFQIRERMIHRTSNTTRIIDKLRQKGLIEQQLCPSNRRRVEVSITGKGLDLLLQIDPVMTELQARSIKNISPEEARTLNEILDKLRND